MVEPTELPATAAAQYPEAAVQRLLAEHPDIAEQSIEVTTQGTVLLLRGEVESEQRRAAIVALVGAHYPELVVRDDIGVTRCAPPAGPEELS